MKEEWKDIEGYEGKYQVSNLGRFRGPRGIHKGHVQKSGYVYVTIFDKPKQRVLTLHRLVATYFCQHPDGCDVVDHIDSNKGNNAASNLEWVTQAENVKRSEANGTMVHHNNFYFKRPVIISKDDLSLEFESMADAARYIGTERTEISKTCKGIYPSVKGWKCKWK